MKFDFCIGNPPYQETQEATSDKPVYNHFIDAAYGIADKVELITPARFLFNAGKTPKTWNQKMLDDEHVKVAYYEQNSSKVFTNTDIKGGVAITYRDANKYYGAIKQFTNFPELNTILHKVISETNFQTLDDYVILQNRWNLENLYSEYPNLKIPYLNKAGKKVYPIGSEGKERRLTTSIFSLKDVFTDTQESDCYKILGLQNNKRIYKFVKKSLIADHQNIDKWKVILPKSNGSGAIGEVLSTPLIGTPLIGFTQSFISIGEFDRESDAIACFKYIKTKFARTLLGVLKVTQDNNKGTWKYVPLQDFTSSSDIDWLQSVADIDKQLYKKYNLSDEEINFIETNVKEME